MMIMSAASGASGSVCGSLTDEHINGLTAHFHTDGFVVLRNILKDGNNNSAPVIDEIYDYANKSFDEAHEIINSKNLTFGVGTKNGFKEIVERHHRRFEMPYKMSANEVIESKIKQHPVVSAIVQSILGADAACINQSLVMCMPGSEVSLPDI